MYLNGFVLPLAWMGTDKVYFWIEVEMGWLYLNDIGGTVLYSPRFWS